VWTPCDRHLLGDGEVVVPGILPVDQPDRDGLLADLRPDLDAVAQQPVHVAVRVVEGLAAAERRGLVQLEERPLDELLVVSLAPEPVR
jgi:hypothetical protein